MAHISITQVETPEQIAAVQRLFREYVASLSTDLCFQGFDAEIAGLPGKYAPPQGRLWLAYLEKLPVGCIALRPYEGMIAEAKRLYVTPLGRGHELGRKLMVNLLTEARAIGYQAVYLDTMPEMERAIALYEKLGFRDIPPYNDNPVSGVRFMAFFIDE